MKKSDVERAFRDAGKIERISLSTAGPFQQAIITFTLPDTIEPYMSDVWQIFIQGHAVRTTPVKLSQHDFEKRSEYTARLSGFDYKLLASDFLPVIQNCSIKTITIPRTEFEYRQRPWAYVTFVSDEMKQNAMERSVALAGRKLYWTEANFNVKDKPVWLCLQCGSPEHIRPECPFIKKRPPRKVISDKWQQVYNRFAPAGHTRGRSQNRARSRSQSNRRTPKEHANTNDNNGKRRQGVSYADSLAKGSGLDASIHNPHNTQSTRTGGERSRIRSEQNKDDSYDAVYGERYTKHFQQHAHDMNKKLNDLQVDMTSKLDSIMYSLEKLNSTTSFMQSRLYRLENISAAVAIKVGIDPENDVLAPIPTPTTDDLTNAFPPRQQTMDMDETEEVEPSFSSYDCPMKTEELKKLSKAALIKKCAEMYQKADDDRFAQETLQEEVRTMKVDLTAYQQEIAKLTSHTQTLGEQLRNFINPNPNQ